MDQKLRIILALLVCVCVEISVTVDFIKNGVAHGKWNKHYNNPFPYEIDGQHYFYAQSIPKDGSNWFIQQLNSGGQMGIETDNGTWNQNYKTNFYYSIDGGHYFFGQSINGSNYFTQQLLAGGKIGVQKANNFFDYFYPVMFSFSIKSRTFFYGQSMIKNYFIQELQGNGQLAPKEVANGNWNNYYDISFPFSIGGRQFFYGQTRSEGNYYFIQEIMEDGSLAKETDSDLLDYSGDTQFPFKFDDRQFIYIEDGDSWYTAQITSEGKLKSRTYQGELTHHDFAFTIDGGQQPLFLWATGQQ